jgi:hypothetical protein
MSVAFVREESAEAAQEVGLSPRAISSHPKLVTRSGLRALEQALANSQQALKASQAREDATERRRALELAARDAQYFAERVASAVLQPAPADTIVVAFGPRSRSCATTVAARHSGSLARTRRIPAADRSPMCPHLPIGLLESESVRP